MVKSYLKIGELNVQRSTLVLPEYDFLFTLGFPDGLREFHEIHNQSHFRVFKTTLELM